MLILTILFLVPLFLVLVSKLYTNIRFWETREYSFFRFWQFASWEIDKSPKEILLDLLKLSAFALTGIFLFSFTSYITIIGIWIAYAVWVDESMGLSYKLLTEGGRPKISWRGTLILLLGTIGIAALLILYLSTLYTILSTHLLQPFITFYSDTAK